MAPTWDEDEGAAEADGARVESAGAVAELEVAKLEVAEVAAGSKVELGIWPLEEEEAPLATLLAGLLG